LLLDKSDLHAAVPGASLGGVVAEVPASMFSVDFAVAGTPASACAGDFVLAGTPASMFSVDLPVAQPCDITKRTAAHPQTWRAAGKSVEICMEFNGGGETLKI
jgi:hypothetical protein